MKLYNFFRSGTSHRLRIALNLDFPYLVHYFLAARNWHLKIFDQYPTMPNAYPETVRTTPRNVACHVLIQCVGLDVFVVK